MKRTHYIFFILFFLAFVQLLADDPPRRIISLAPHITEIIYKIGAGDMLVGRTEFCLYPKAAGKVETVGGYANTDWEKIAILEPDIIFLFPNVEIERKLQIFGYKTFSVPNETIEDILQSIEVIGRILGLSENAARVINGIQDTLNWVRDSSLTDYSPSTMLVVGREAGSLKGLYAAGQNTYISEILNLCGGQNIFSDVQARYFDVSKEDLIKRDPDVILEFHMIDANKAVEETPRLISDWEQKLPLLKAVQTKQIFILTDRYFIIPGPRISQIALALHRLLNMADK